MTKSPEVRNKQCVEELSSSSALSMTGPYQSSWPQLLQHNGERLCFTGEPKQLADPSYTCLSSRPARRGNASYPHFSSNSALKKTHYFHNVAICISGQQHLLFFKRTKVWFATPKAPKCNSSSSSRGSNALSGLSKHQTTMRCIKMHAGKYSYT